MSTPDPNADRARCFAEQFNSEEERAFRSRWLRELRRKLFPELIEEDLDAFDAPDEIRDPDSRGDAVGFFVSRG